jgi:cytochrome c oxidase subunit 2
MTRKWSAILVVMVFFALALAACGGGGGDQEGANGDTAGTCESITDDQLISDGEGVYANNCASCHQPDGTGVEGSFPALAGDTFVTGAEDQVVDVVVHGRNGMPAFGDQLSSDQIASVISYVRNSFGNSASVVCPETVAAVQGQ